MFVYFAPVYFLITMTENKPTDPINMAEGCHLAWYGQVLQFIIIYNTSINFDYLWTKIGMERIDYIRDFTFAYLTVLEFLYPQLAYCWTSFSQFSDVATSTWKMLEDFPLQLLFNIVKNIGTILYSLITFPDCWQSLNGQCAGQRLGMVMYAILNYRYDFSKGLVSFDLDSIIDKEKHETIMGQYDDSFLDKKQEDILKEYDDAWINRD